MEPSDETRAIVQNGMDATQATPAGCMNGGAESDSASSNMKHNENAEDLDSWNPMSEDYQSKVFNNYKEPSVTEFVHSFPGNMSPTPAQSSLMTEQGDIRLYVGNVPQEMTQDGLRNLFGQVGKVVYCKMVPRHDQDTKIAFVGYGTVREAEAAIQKFNGFDLGQGISLRVKLSVAKEKPTLWDLEEKQRQLNVVEPINVMNGIQNGIEDKVPECNSDVNHQDAVSPAASESKRLSTGKPCSFCGHLGLKWCSVCKIPYCSRDCQKNDWPQHRLVCPPPKSAERTSNSTPATPGDTCTSHATPGDPVQPSVPDQERTTPSHILPEETAQPTVLNQEQTTSTPSDNQIEPSPDQNNPEFGDDFDVRNAEKFAEMCGFDLTPLKKIVERSKDYALSDKSSSSSVDTAALQEAPTEKAAIPPPVSENPVERDPRGLQRPVFDPGSKEPISPTAFKVSPPGDAGSQQPTCAKGLKRIFIKQLTMESTPPDGLFEAVVTEVENPSFFWAQLCSPEALERQEQLKNELQAAYGNSVYEHYVPSGGEVCVVHFSFNSLWCRAKVDLVNNTGTMRVTYIDYGNHEDIALDKIRRIKEEFVKFPRQALRLSLHSVSSSSGEWSPEAVSFLKSKVLGQKCKAQVRGQHNEILFVQLFDPKDPSSDSTLNNSLIDNGYAQSRSRKVSSPDLQDQHKSVAGSQRGSRPLSDQPPNMQGQQPGHTRQMPGAQSPGQRHPGPSGTRRDFQGGGVNRSSEQGRQGGGGWQHNDDSQGRGVQHTGTSNPQNPTGYSRNPVHASPPKENRDTPRNPINPTSPRPRQDDGRGRENRQRSEPFEVVINAIVSPWEFYAQKTDQNLLHQLSMLMQDLNQHMLNSPAASAQPGFAVGDMCAAKFSADSQWYRAVVLERLDGAFRVRYVDFGNSEVVQHVVVRPLPQQFQGFAPLSLMCSLAGVTKPRGPEWSSEAVALFKSSVANKRLTCCMVYTHDKTGTNIVNLLDPSQGGQATVANALISAGLADAFVPKETPFSPQASGSPSRDQQGPSPRNRGSWPNKGERIESAVFEPAIQAAALPQDASFDVVVTDIVSPKLIFVQNGSVESIQKGAKLSQDMNSHYGEVKYPPFTPRESDLCAALFSETGDWCRAFIKGISPDGSVYVHYVDFGNTEMVPVDRLRPLLEQFHFKSVPFCALRCSLAFIAPLDGTMTFPDEATNTVKSSLSLSSRRYSAKLVGQRKGILFVDITLENGQETVSQALVSKGLAKRMGRGSTVQNPQYTRPGAHQNRNQTNTGAQDIRPEMQRLPRTTDDGIASPREQPYMGPGPHQNRNQTNTGAQDSRPDMQRSPRATDGGITSPREQMYTGPGPHQNRDQTNAGVQEDRPEMQRLPSATDGGITSPREHVNTGPSAHQHMNQTNAGAQDIRPNMQRSPKATDDSITSPRGQPKSSEVSPLESLVFQPAIQSATLPQEKALLSVMVTEISTSSTFFVQIADRETGLRLQNLSTEMNHLYQSSQPGAHQTQPHQLCAALFRGTGDGPGDWCRAFVKEITLEGLVDVHYVDFGNSEKLPASSIRPLDDRMASYPYVALPCSLANISPPQPPGWSALAMDLIRENVPLFECIDAKLVERHSDMLFVDFVISQNSQQTLAQLLVNQGFAKRTTRSDRLEGDVHHDHPRDSPQPQEGSRPASRQSNSSTSSSRRVSRLASCVFEPAIQAVTALDAFNAMVTHVESPSCLFVQVLSHEKAHSLDQLSVEMNAHYGSASYPAYQALANQMCAALFTGSGDWCRAFIDELALDGSVHVHYLDYGNSEQLPLSRVRPVEKKFLELPPMALRCCLTGVCPVSASGWSDDACKALVTQAPLLSGAKVKVVRKERALLFVDATPLDSPNQETLSQILINQGHAKGEGHVQEPARGATVSPGREHRQQRHESSHADVPGGDKYGSGENPPMRNLESFQAGNPAVAATQNIPREERVFASVIPLVAISCDGFCEVLISEVQGPDKIYFQVLNQENAQGLAALSKVLIAHCSGVDNTPYRPVLAELCCARFSLDGDWYRAVIEQEVSESQMAVVFVDYGNQDIVPVEGIRRIPPSFTQLPFQARRSHLAGIQPAVGSVWSHDAAEFLKSRLTDQRLLAKIVSTTQEELAIELFEIAPSGQPGASISQDMIQRNYARNQECENVSKLPMRFPDTDQFDAVVTDVLHPGEIWAQVSNEDARNSLNALMEKINIYCQMAPVPTIPPHPGMECCAQFSLDNTWYRANVLECPNPGQVVVQYVDFGNSEVTSPDRLRAMNDEFLDLPSQAVKLSMAGIRPTQQVWSPETVDWLRQLVNRQLKATVVHRLPEHLVVVLEDWAVADGPVNINEQLVLMGFAVKS